jgi:phosphatidylglycerophosphatase A
MRTSLPSLLKNPVHFLSLGFGAGLVPYAPGTAGTVVALPIYAIIQLLPLSYYLVFLLMTTLVGFIICHYTATVLGRDDPPQVVWDEMVGYWVTMALAPHGWRWAIFGFVLFRAFDIVKPWPIRWVERAFPGGLGIMLDDIVAGIYAAVCIQIFVWIGFTFML